MESAEPIPSRATLEKAYKANLRQVEDILASMLALIQKTLQEAGLSPAYKHRIKTFQSYFAKRIKFLREASKHGSNALPITDLIAVRIICPFIGDLERVESALSTRFNVREVERKGSERSFKEFGYESTHLLLEIPDDILNG
ncbi:MAG: RelA/SpoT domain-containing protein, partial [Spirochaetales bacterium]|nr:RelA/SpoT domain-containing protein [Spirochaetales bacterium]